MTLQIWRKTLPMTNADTIGIDPSSFFVFFFYNIRDAVSQKQNKINQAKAYNSLHSFNDVPIYRSDLVDYSIYISGLQPACTVSS